ncbi:non-ribosomal peptide synthetase [Actinoplanes teichomyceticus]|uniref:Nocardicin nonribosomal peptide synthetase NocB n=1 Tax=Actinoplanes teichomyceticus TaxID=1867 RepID=A0A561VIE3_ACTTI|nr:non-ribosomal peptide synthetase [Actinoplanes teichomyceticus]TWG11354.1 nocardicin nonribosomal peptide synthetase NocB [Actinoplanes teichomyceticus]GIF15830.1 hypothetical protein Ate01nite_58620 [Actinoplanes teichomyceticus]
MTVGKDFTVSDLLGAEPDEIELQIGEWNATGRRFTDDRGVHELIQARVRARPDAPAVRCGDRELTYAELDAAARTVAARLHRLGVRPGEVVAIGLPPSADRMVALLGTLYAGAAYLPLDLEYPAARLTFMLRDSGAAALVTDSATAAAGLRGDAGPTLLLDEAPPAGLDPAALPGFPGPQLPAYVIYTSGSTGRPKAVLVGHRGLVNRLEWMARAYAVGPGDRVLHKTSFGFDVSVWEQLLPLVTGATVVVAPPQARRDMAALVRLIRADRVTVTHFVPSVLPAFLDTEGTPECTSLRLAVCSGETLPKPTAAAFARALPGCALHNLYGPTEATIDVTAWPVDVDDSRPFVPIGRPIDNIRAYVLDERLQPLPIGVEGELFLGGVGVAMGYLGRPALTAERFVPDPYAVGERLYATGDRARFGADGVIEFLGRRDHQVKVRGYRIELGEIESALLDVDGVRQAVVVLRATGANEQLVAYVCGPGGPVDDDDPAGPRAALAARLPDYMVPSRVVWLAEIPLTAAGKVDRAALPEVADRTDGPRAEPVTDVQRRLAEVWSELLGGTPPGIDDDFFQSGGDSVSSMRLVARARRHGILIEVADVFSGRTIRSLAEAAGRAPQPAEAPAGPADDPLLAGIDPGQLARVRRDTGAVDVYPLAPMQAGMLFRGLYWPDSDAYFNQNVLELSGPVDEEKLRRAWRMVADRYEILRTGFRWSDLDEPLQYVLADVEPPWTTLDWSAQDRDGDRSGLDDLLAEDRARGLSLDECPLYRVVLVRRGPGRHYLVWSHHHILLDGWCLSLIWGDVFKIYEALVTGREPELAPCRPFRDYLRWLRGRQDREAEAERFWREYLRDLTPAAFSGHPVDQEGLFGTIVRELPVELTTALADRARNAGVTTNAVIQAVWAIMLGLRTGSDDVVHGLTIAGRPPELEGSEQMVGLFINTLPLRTRLSGNPTLTELLRRIHGDLAATAAHGHVPLAQIKSWGSGVRMAGGRVFDSLIAFENYPEDNLPAEGELSIGITDLHAQEKTEYPIGLIVLPGQRLSCHFNYDTTHFDDAEITRVIETFELLLRQIVERPDLRLRELELVGATDARRLAERNDTAERWPESGTLLELFQRQAATTPHAEAISDNGSSLTYAELDAAAARSAARLAEAGVEPSDLVGLCLPRGTDFVVALLACYRAGAVPVLLDPDQPAARRRLIARDAGVRAVVAAGAADFAGWPVLGADGSFTAGGGAPGGVTRLPADLVACVTYTSGSTGAPKGVVSTQRGIVNRMLWSRREFATAQPPRLLATASVAFDIALWEVFFPLLAGGTVVTAPPRAVLDPDRLVDLVVTERATVLHLLPSLLAAFLDAPGVGRCQGLRHILSGGEAVTPGLVRAYAASGLTARLHQAYGPTEASISVTHWTCAPSDAHRTLVPIGAPISNTRLYVVDDRLRQVPLGVEGELAIAGTPLAVGYLGQSRQTAEHFVPDPFGAPGERLYLTGDRARWTAGGELEFLGRRDRQQKIRGHRVEPAEVEAVLERHPGVRQAITVAGADQLTTFVVPAARESLDIAGLTRWARERLPDWMLGPLVPLDTPPLTGNGKVDMVRLAELVRAAPGAGSADEVDGTPRNDLERALLGCFERVLGGRRLGIHDDFFDHGGHSMLVIRLLREFREHLPAGVAVNVTQIFKAPTVASLAEQLVGPVAGTGSAYIETLNPDAADALFLVHAGEGMAQAYRTLAPHLPGTRIHALSNPRFGRADARFASIAEMAVVYVEWVRALQPVGPYRLGGWSFGGTVALEMARHMSRHGDDVELVLMIDSHDLSDDKARGDDPRQGVREHVAALGLDPDGAEGRDLVDELLHSGHLATVHRPGAYPGRVVLLQADGGDNGWNPELLPGLRVERLPGAHLRLFDPDHVAATAAAIHRALAAPSTTDRDTKPETA